MSDIESVVGELRGKYARDRLYVGQADHLLDADVEKWSRMLHLSRSELYDFLGLYLARGFQNSQLPFDFCDAVMNGLHSVITFADGARRTRFWKVYLAFDEGEYRHKNDEPGTGPVETYTRPMLTEIVLEYADIQIK